MGRGQSDSRVLYAYPAEHPACAQRAAFHQRRHLAACGGGIDLPWRGVGSGVPSWGRSLSTSVRFISIYPMAVLWPGLVVTVVVIALNLFGDALRDAIDIDELGIEGHRHEREYSESRYLHQRQFNCA